jgi:hypothetical protein
MQRSCITIVSVPVMTMAVVVVGNVAVLTSDFEESTDSTGEQGFRNMLVRMCSRGMTLTMVTYPMSIAAAFRNSIPQS